MFRFWKLVFQRVGCKDTSFKSGNWVRMIRKERMPRGDCSLYINLCGAGEL